MSELLPCPFCGCEARICAKHFTDGTAYAWVECGCCHAKSRYSDSLEDLNFAWNARAGNTAQLIQELDDAKVEIRKLERRGEYMCRQIAKAKEALR